jgi:hypothetical protein
LDRSGDGPTLDRIAVLDSVEAEASGQTNIGKMYLTFLLVNDGGQWKIVHEGSFDMQAA